MKFIDEINSYDVITKFIAEWSKESVVFLDTKVIREGNKLIIDLYTKTYRYPPVHPSTKLSSRQL